MKNPIPQPVTRLIEAFSALPGVGPKSASRLTFFLLRSPDAITDNLAEALASLKEDTTFCDVCFNITDAENNPCVICSDDSRDAHTIAVVEEPLDAIALERTGSYKGRYHILHGVISPVNGIGPEDIRINELLKRVADSEILEVIIATNPGMEGDATAMYIQSQLGNQVKVTRLARGLPMGGDLEYVDPVTLLRALQGRTSL
jgi:recombination protein RecR